MLSIGPYHHGKENLRKMENYKLEYLQGILKRQNETGAERYIAASIEVEEEARSYYADNVDFSPDAFVEMMLLDGRFIVEFLRKYILRMKSPFVEILWGDLLLFENQLPFFILAKLFDMTKIPGQEEDLIDLAISRLRHCNPAREPSSAKDIRKQKKIFHLLDLMYRNWCFPFTEEGGQSSGLGQKSCFSVITFCPKLKRKFGNQEQNQEDEIDFIKSLGELEAHGIKFKAAKQGTPWLHISFKKGVIEIPTLVVEDSTESLLRNLIAYEEDMFDPGISRKFVIDYTTFMDCLINSSEDVKRLRHENIIKSWLGSDEAISSMFNKIGNNVFVLSSQFTYLEVFKNVNKYCSQKRHTWKADLKNRYFKNPWSIISFVAATVLLLLTLVQTVFSVLQYVEETKGKNGGV